MTTAGDIHKPSLTAGTNKAAADIAVVGAGAAGLFAAIFAARRLTELRPDKPPRIVALDGAKKLGAKILVAGGGRCNVTHHAVDARAYAGSSPNAIKKVLARFTVEDTRRFFADYGVQLKREDTGKLFPVSDSARDVLDALLTAAHDAGVSVRHPWRVGQVQRTGNDQHGFLVVEADTTETAEETRRITAERVVFCTGGMSLPKTGSDGAGYGMVRSLGLSITDRIFPSLVPLKLDKDATSLHELSGIACPVVIEARSAKGKRIARFENAMLCTHFGVSGPAALDVSRYYLEAANAEPGASLVVNWLPGETFESTDATLRDLGARTLLSTLRDRLPERLARVLCEEAGADPLSRGADLRKDARRALAHKLTEHQLPIAGDRGFLYAEVTAGGVPLKEVELKHMESRACPGLHLAGEICDVDGRIGGFNFQWAWASGYAAGIGAAEAIVQGPAALRNG